MQIRSRFLVRGGDATRVSVRIKKKINISVHITATLQLWLGRRYGNSILRRLYYKNGLVATAVATLVLFSVYTTRKNLDRNKSIFRLKKKKTKDNDNNKNGLKKNIFSALVVFLELTIVFIHRTFPR